MNDDLWITIPTGHRNKYLSSIIESSNVSKEKIVIVHTENNEKIEGVNNLWDTNDINIYRWWNTGIKYAMEHGARYVAVLNDDIELIDDPLNKIVDQMRIFDIAIGIPYPHTGHICGYAWILDTTKGIFPDENFKWWYGDDDLFRRVERIIRVESIINHIEPNRLTSINPELMKIAESDKQYYNKKWNS